MTMTTKHSPDKYTMKTVAALAVVVIAMFSSACGSKKDDTRDAAAVAPAPIVLGAMDIATAESRAISQGITLSGNLDPADVVELKAQIPGTVTGVRVDRGTAVRRGSVLAVIEAQGIRSQAAGAAAQVSAARAQLSIAEQQLAGSKKLFDAGAISAIEYKTAQANYEAAQAQVALARAQSAGAGESASRATITSPINGVVSARAVNGGEAVNVGAPLFTVVNASELELAGQVSVQEAARVRVGQPVTFTLDAYPGQVMHGRVARVDPTADPGTRQVGVYVRLSNPGNRIIGGQFAHGTIESGTTANAVVIPQAAIAGRSGNTGTVFVITGNKLSKRAIVLGGTDATTGAVAVASGVTAGERVLLNPTTDTRDGAIVTISAGPSPDAQKRAAGADSAK
jgi:RND family efflux transporter MFP subunit